MSKTWYLKDKNGEVVAKFEQEDDEYGFAGELYTCFSWDADTGLPFEYGFHSHVMCKWDGCTHWYFDGEDVGDVNHYYHLHADGLEMFFAEMSFVWQLAEKHWIEFAVSHGETQFCLSEDIKKEYKSDLVDYILKDYEITEVI